MENKSPRNTQLILSNASTAGYNIIIMGNIACNALVTKFMFSHFMYWRVEPSAFNSRSHEE